MLIQYPPSYLEHRYHLSYISSLKVVFGAVPPGASPSKYKLRHCLLLGSVELLVEEMQQQINVELEVALEQSHELVGLELCLQEVLNRHQGTGSRDLDVSSRTLKTEDTHFVT
jgi:hypothetical protein